TSATAFGAGAGGVTASAAKNRDVGVRTSVTLAALVETFAAVGASVGTGAVGFNARALLLSIVELTGAFLSCEFAGAERSAALFVPVDLLVFLIVNFAEFIFKFT